MPMDDTLEEGEEQGGDTKVQTLSQGRRPSGQPPVYTPLDEESSEVPAELADTAVSPI